ncbi:MAG: hypothetical protein VB050_03445 [Geobacteraceae bacterium]|nr:hypothetical protein [Geobacteraceae bacterium]
MDFLDGITGAERIRSVMAARRVTNKKIAKIMDVSVVYVSYVIHRVRKGYRIREAIAKECGVPVSFLWPDEESDLPQAA